MKIAICESSDIDGQYLQNLLKEYSTALYNSAEKLLYDVEGGKDYDLYLLDIYLSSMNGIELAKRLREQDGEAAICFISSSDAFYREAYDLYAIQYLLKPVRQEALLELIERVENQRPRISELSLRFKWRGKLGSIAYNKILFVSSQEHKLSIYCNDGTVQECMGKMSEIAEQICGDTFLRVHQSYLVNRNYVDSLSGSEIIVAGHNIPVSRRYAAEVKKRYQKQLFIENPIEQREKQTDDKKAESN